MVVALVGSTLAASAISNDKVIGGTYVRHDGGTDAAITECNSAASDDTFAAPAGADSYLGMVPLSRRDACLGAMSN